MAIGAGSIGISMQSLDEVAANVGDSMAKITKRIEEDGKSTAEASAMADPMACVGSALEERIAALSSK
jgi:hypothetical protein